uniref:TPR domain protein n=1 Tax=Geobacter metallireducens TaxID=28232 RepID=A0A831XLB1_GEOME
MSLRSRVNSPHPPERVRFLKPPTVLGIFCAFVAVLALLFPERSLLTRLNDKEDAATIRYREAVLRVRPNDVSLRIIVAESLLRAGNNERAIETLKQLPPGLTADQKRSVAELRYHALRNMLLDAGTGTPQWQNLRLQVRSAAMELAGPHPPLWRLQQLAADARAAGDLDAWHDYQKEISAQEATFGQPQQDPFSQALARGDYRAAAAICFSAMGKAATVAQRRELFMKGVRTLQSGNLPLEALRAGERHLDGLSDDRSTLIFLTRVSLAANQPARAEYYIRKALGMTTTPKAADPS